MKLTTAITFAALLAGCAADEDALELRNAYPDGIEVVVIDSADFGDVTSPSSLDRPAFPGGDYTVDNGSKDDFRPLPGRLASNDDFRPVPGRPPKAAHALPGDDRPAYSDDEGVVSGSVNDRDERTYPGNRDAYDVGNDEEDGRIYPGSSDVYDTSDDDWHRFPGNTGAYEIDSPEAGTPSFPADPSQLAAPESDSSSASDPCTCDSTECLEEWIAENLGCNVCATFVCEENSSGACYLCEGE